MTFDVTGTGASDGAGSSKYSEGTITRTGASMVYTFGGISYTGGIGSDQGAGPITGTINGLEVNFAFTGVIGYNLSTDESRAKQWLMPSGSTNWQVNSEYDVGGATDTQIEKRSAIIYLVLDSSRSLNTTQIGQIRDAASQFITSLYDQLNGDSTPSTPSSTPSAPTGVMVMPMFKQDLPVLVFGIGSCKLQRISQHQRVRYVHPGRVANRNILHRLRIIVGYDLLLQGKSVEHRGGKRLFFLYFRYDILVVQ
jgi:hypothetical protein